MYSFPTRIIFGEETLLSLGGESSRFGSKALIVCGRNSLRKTGKLDMIQKTLSASGVKSIVFDQVDPDPTTEMVDCGCYVARQNDVDLVIGVGGGSSIDAAKAIASVATQELTIEEAMRSGLSQKGLPCIAIPTTSGTGAEVTGISVISIEGTNRKDALRSFYNYPNLSVIDPRLTYTLPKKQTGITGIDALSHGIEAFLSVRANPFSDLYAVKAIELIGANLPRVLEDPSDSDARTKMSLASCMAGVAISQAGTGGAHGIGMSLGGIFHIPHGMAVGISLPRIMEFNAPMCLPKLKQIGVLLGVTSNSGDNFENAYAVISAVSDIVSQTSIPKKLSELGLKEADLGKLLEDTMTQGAWRDNPRPASKENVRDIISDMF